MDFTKRDLEKLLVAIKDEPANTTICIGEYNDKIGRLDRSIIGFERRQCGFDESNTYIALVSSPCESSGAAKFWGGK